MFEYKQYEYSEIKTYGTNTYQFDPTVAVPVPDDHEDSGRTLADIYGMTDAEADAVVLAEKWIQARKYRDDLLKESDWVSGEDVPQAIKDAWFPYRQSLRDVTSASTVETIVWPTKP